VEFTAYVSAGSPVRDPAWHFTLYRPKKSLQFLDSPVMYLQVNYNPVMGLQF